MTMHNPYEAEIETYAQLVWAMNQAPGKLIVRQTPYGYLPGVGITVELVHAETVECACGQLVYLTGPIAFYSSTTGRATADKDQMHGCGKWNTPTWNVVRLTFGPDWEKPLIEQAVRDLAGELEAGDGP